MEYYFSNHVSSTKSIFLQPWVTNVNPAPLTLSTYLVKQEKNGFEHYFKALIAIFVLKPNRG